jgi:hypothetical protein
MGMSLINVGNAMNNALERSAPLGGRSRRAIRKTPTGTAAKIIW